MPANADGPARPWNGTLARSRLFDAISLLLPAAEAFLISTVEQWLAQVPEPLAPAMRTDVERFLREERAHQNVHDRYNEALLSDMPGAQETARRARCAVDDLAGLDLPTKMALAAAFEYLTSLLSHEVLLEGSCLLAPQPSTQGRVWRWHAREELAHSHIVADAAAHLGLGGVRRRLAYVAATAYLVFDVLRFWLALCRCDIAAGAGRWKVCGQVCAFGGRCVPALARMALGWLRYFLPDARSFIPPISAAAD
jgi:predicted metal-dependent hydrolase